MKIRTDNIFCLSPVPFLAVFLFLMLLNSCSEKQTGLTVPEKKMPEKVFVSILTDLYLTDGLLTVQQIRGRFPGKDSLSAYIDIIQNYGYTKTDMDQTLEYYFVKKPKRLIKIYDKIMGELTEIDIRLSNIPTENTSPDNNLWNGLESYNFPDPSGLENPEFSLYVKSQSFYTLTFIATIYPADQTANPRFMAWFCNADSSETGKKYFLPPIKYFKDGRPHKYVVTGKNENNSTVILKGSLYDTENNPDYGERYGRIENIEFLSSGGI